MHNDETVWQILGNNFCAFKAKLLDNAFCRNPYNVTGQCNRASCPLANGYYATVIEDEGQCYLCLKTIERAHLPRRMWEKVKLSNNYQEALAQIELHMKNIYKEHQIHRCKQRLTRLRQTLIRMRKMQLTPQTKLVPVKKKTERREASREKKAEVAARLEISIEQELLNRLKQGVYGDVYNYDKESFEKILDEKEAASDEENTASDLEFTEDSDDVEVEDEIDADEERLKQLRAECEEEDIEDFGELSDAPESDEEKPTHRPHPHGRGADAGPVTRMCSDEDDVCSVSMETRSFKKQRRTTADLSTVFSSLPPSSRESTRSTGGYRKPNNKAISNWSVTGPRIEIEYEYDAPQLQELE